MKQIFIMKKSRILVALLSSGILFLISFIPISYGNPVIIYSKPNFKALLLTLGLLIYLLLITIIIELGLLYLIFHKDIVDSRCSLKFIKSVIVVNLFTFPITQLVGLILSVLSIQIFLLILLSEVFPFSIEYTLYLRIFDAFYESQDFVNPIPKKKVSFSTIIANLTTMLLGIFIFLPQILSTAFG